MFMNAKVLNFRQGRHTQKTNQILLSVRDVTDRKGAAKLVGKKVVLKTKSGKEIVGKVASPHGNSGVLRARFSRGVPGDFLGKEIEIRK
jgi:large subunit ribosomal protein L35Ae